MNFHNPANLDPSLVGPNHKLLTQDDLDKPLPEGAEFWDEKDKDWFNPRTKHPCFGLTYRIPLSLSDRLRSERDRLDEQIRVVEAVEKGAELEIDVSGNGSGRWAAPGASEIKYYFSDGKLLQPIRLKPAAPTPRSIPWTLETRPMTEVWVRSKLEDSGDEFQIVRWSREGVNTFGLFITYETLHSDWLQRNGEPAGQPCGTGEEVQG